MWTSLDTGAMFVLLATVFLIVRWRRWGVLASIVLGYLAICWINVWFAGATRHDREALEEWPTWGLMTMPVWSLLVYGGVLVHSAYRKWKQEEDRRAAKSAMET